MAMNNEPVAWMQIFENQNKERKLVLNFDRIGKNDIPLYTHPHSEESVKAKTLTDEEIINIIERLIDKWTDEFKNYEYDSDESEENKLRDDVFAILRKAQK